jgi:hypothetical protein
MAAALQGAQRSACSSTSAAAGQRCTNPLGDGSGMEKGLLALQSAVAVRLLRSSNAPPVCPPDSCWDRGWGYRSHPAAAAGLRGLRAAQGITATHGSVPFGLMARGVTVDPLKQLRGQTHRLRRADTSRLGHDLSLLVVIPTTAAPDPGEVPA